MCGISGIINGSVLPIMECLKHRGDHPGLRMVNGRYVGYEYEFEIGHNRLAIIDLSDKGVQPIKKGKYQLTYNGEIYNYNDFYTGPNNDAHALLDSINKIGLRSTLNILNGMFAFALHDTAEQKIHLVVDRFGQKPLYYFSDGTQFSFASSPNALLHLKEKWQINRKALVSYWRLGSTMGKESIWQGINRVEGGYVVTYDVKSGRLTQERYWTPQFQENTNDIEDLIIDAIEKVKIADVPVHIFLSGGIDSTLVASRFKGGNAIHLDSAETQYAKAVAEKCKIDLKVVSPLQVDIGSCIRDYARKCGEPSMAGIIPYITAQEVCKHAKVAVTANGADELFFGYDRTSDKITDAQLDHMFRRQFAHDWKPDSIDERLPMGRWLELQAYVQYDLNKTLDFASMAHTVEMRAPFLDHRLVEMALSIPQHEHGRKEILKGMLRREGFDEAFLQRPKQGFSLTVQPENMKREQINSVKWCRDNGFLPEMYMNGRDQQYTAAAALGFYYWYQEFKHIIE